MSELKPYEEAIAYFEQLSQRFEDTPDETYWGKVHNKTSREMIATALDALRRSHPANEPLTCKGCENDGEYGNEIEYGYPSPCTACKRRVLDNYRRKPERSKNDG